MSVKSNRRQHNRRVLFKQKSPGIKKSGKEPEKKKENADQEVSASE